MAAIRRLLEWDFATYKDETNNEGGIGDYDLATGEWRASMGAMKGVVAVIFEGATQITFETYKNKIKFY